MQLSVGTQPGLDYMIQATGSLHEPVWTDGEIIHGDGTVKQLKAAKIGTSGFYRVKATD